MATGSNKNLDKLMNKINTETGRSDAEEILRLQALWQLKSEHKKVSQMTDFEKQLFAEMEQKTVEKYEEKFLSDKPLTYTDGIDIHYSPIASIVLEAFFTRWQKLRHGFPCLNFMYCNCKYPILLLSILA